MNSLFNDRAVEWNALVVRIVQGRERVDEGPRKFGLQREFSTRAGEYFRILVRLALVMPGLVINGIWGSAVQYQRSRNADIASAKEGSCSPLTLIAEGKHSPLV